MALWDDEQLQGILAKSAIWASEEVVLPTLVALLGHEVLANPCSYDLVQYRVRYTVAQLDAAMHRPSVFWIHPVPRSYGDPLRSQVRTHFGGYAAPLIPTPPNPFATQTQRLPLLLPLIRRIERIEGWLSAAEADLLAAVAVQAIGSRPGPHTMVEVGSYCGRATVVLGTVAAALSPGSVVHAIDPHDRRLGVWGERPSGVPNPAARLQAHLDAAGLGSAVDYRGCYASEVALPGPIDLLVIDHLHDYASVAADFSQFHGALAEGALVVFHDYADYFPGVVAFVDQLLSTSAYTAVQRVETLTVVRRTGTLHLPPLGAALADAGSALERDALALLAVTAADALDGGHGGIVDAGRPTTAEDRVLAAAAQAAGRDYAKGQPPEQTSVRLLIVGGATPSAGDVDTALAYRQHLSDGALVALRGCPETSPSGMAALRALSEVFDRVRTVASLAVLRAGAARPTAVVPDHGQSTHMKAAARAELADRAIRSRGPTRPGQPDEPLVSCIMPTCDRRRYAARAIRYFLAQDYPNRELVVVDDGSDCVADLIPDDPRLRYVRLDERRTIGAKRNLACEHAHGELVMHWDDDDWSAPTRLGYQVEMFNKQDVDVSGLSAVYFCDPAGRQAWRYEYPKARRPWVHDATFCYRRAFWADAPFPDTSFGIDTSYLWQGLPKRVGTVPDPSFYVALIHGGNTSRKHVHDPWWHPRPVEEIASLLGPEWTSHWANEPVP